MEETFRTQLFGQGLSALSVKTYLQAVRLYFALYRDVDQQHLQEFRQYLIAHYKAKTVNLYIIGLNKYLAFIGMDRWRLLGIKEIERSYLDNVISNNQYTRLKQQLKENGDLKWYHVVWTLGSTGVRVSELVRIRVEDISTGYLDICSKGSKVRRVFIPRSLQRSLLAWCKEQRRNSGPLFPNVQGLAISPRGISKGLQHLARTYNIDPRLMHPHGFRHLFAKNFLSHRNDMALLADLLGHKSLETTKIYLRYTMQEQQNIINQIVDW